MTQKPVFLEGIFTLHNLRSVGTAAILEVLLAFGITGILIWQQLQPVTQPRTQPPPIVEIYQKPPQLPHNIPTPQPPQQQPLFKVPSVPTPIPSPTSEPLQPPHSPWVPGQPSQVSEDLVNQFSTKMLRAINDQKVYPKVALLQAVTGEAVISFDYVDGVVSNIHVDRSSGSPELDQAAIQAVQKAALPPKPAELVGLSHFVFHLAFNLGG